MTRTLQRNLMNNVMLTLTGVCTVLTVSILFLILGFLVWNGWRSLDWNFFVKLPLPAGESGADRRSHPRFSLPGPSRARTGHQSRRITTEPRWIRRYARLLELAM